MLFWETGLIVLCGLWCWAFGYLFLAAYRLPHLHRLAMADAPQWPALSVIVPACNEAANLEAALATLLQQDYPKLEIIAVDDRSSDGTGAIVDRLAASDSRVRAVHVTSLPADWLGKVHALQRGIDNASGDWLLFTDADVHFAQGTLKRSLALAMAKQLDHLALVPRTSQRGFFLDIAVAAFGLLFLLGTRAANLNRPGTRSFAGVGAFNLVRRECLQRTDGFAWLRLEPCDDVALALTIKRAGGRSFFAMARHELTVAWYPSLRAMFRGLEKNIFGATANYRWWMTMVQVFALMAVAMAPLSALFLAASRHGGLLLYASLTALTLHGVFCLLAATDGWRGRMHLWFLPVGLWLVAAMMIHAAWRCLSQGGIEWRGTRYSLAQLRAGQRIKFADDGSWRES